MSEEDGINQVKKRNSVNASSASSSGPVVYSTLFNQPSAGNVMRSSRTDLSKSVSYNIRFSGGNGRECSPAGTDNLYELHTYLKKQSEDSEVAIKCELEYDGDEMHHEALFYGFNWPQEALDSVNGDWTKLEHSHGGYIHF